MGRVPQPKCLKTLRRRPPDQTWARIVCVRSAFIHVAPTEGRRQRILLLAARLGERVRAEILIIVPAGIAAQQIGNCRLRIRVFDGAITPFSCGNLLEGEERKTAAGEIAPDISQKNTLAADDIGVVVKVAERSASQVEGAARSVVCHVFDLRIGWQSTQIAVHAGTSVLLPLSFREDLGAMPCDQKSA